VALKFESATPEQLERDFGIADLGDIVSRIQIAERLGWTFDVIDRLTWRERAQILGYFNAKEKAAASNQRKQAWRKR